CSSPSLSYNPPLLSKDTVTIHVIKTNFDPSLPENIKFPIIRGDTDVSRTFTESQRHFAEKALAPRTLDEFEDKLQDMLHKGKRENSSTYIRLSNNISKGLNDKLGDYIAFVDRSMPWQIRKNLFNDLCLFSEDLKHTDTRTASSPEYFCTHYLWYNRYSVHGEGVSEDQDPATYVREGKRKINTSAFVPRASQDLHLEFEEHEQLKQIFEGLFLWMRNTLKFLLPEGYAELSLAVSRIPGNEFLPAHPFAGFTLNINVSTYIHRDWKDLKLCLII
ncbi:hypothetical protein K443DRAFT_199129, partial [Laccaria amethystina LaAM-08-1]